MSIVETQRIQAAANLTRAARNAPPATINAAAQLLMAASRREAHAPLMAQVLTALARLSDIGPASQSVRDTESAYGVLIDLLSQPQVLEELRREDPLAPARLRGLRLRERLLEAEGGVCSSAEMAAALGITRQAVDKRRKAGTLIGLDLGRRGYAYPIWQVGLAGLGDVLTELNWLDPWSQVAFMLTPNVWTDDEPPLALLRRGEIATVIEAAHTYGEQSGA